MPKEIENKLKAEAKRKKFGKKRTAAYVYGTINKIGASEQTKREMSNW